MISSVVQFHRDVQTFIKCNRWRCSGTLARLVCGKSGIGSVITRMCVSMVVLLYLCPATGSRPVRGALRLSAEINWHRFQNPSATLLRISDVENGWMDGFTKCYYANHIMLSLVVRGCARSCGCLRPLLQRPHTKLKLVWNMHFRWKHAPNCSR